MGRGARRTWLGWASEIEANRRELLGPVAGLRMLVALLETAARHRIEMILPSVVLAQVWRDGARQARLAVALRNPGLVEAPMNHEDAKHVGALLGASATTDVADAPVAVLARRLRAPVITPDPGDFAKLDAGLDVIAL